MRMIPESSVACSIAYALLAVAAIAFERRRIRLSGPDVLSVFVGLFLAQCVFPGIVIYSLLPLCGPSVHTGNVFFDRAYRALDLPAALLVFGLTAWFLVFFHCGAHLGRRLLKLIPGDIPEGSAFVVSVSIRWLAVALGFGTVFTLISFWLLGDSFVDRYAMLIQVRAHSAETEGNLLASYTLALTQTWGWLAILALFLVRDGRGRQWRWLLCLGLVVLFAIMGVSRRAIFIPLALYYFSALLYSSRWRMKLIAAGLVPIIIWVAFGKEILAAIAFGGKVDVVSAQYQSLAEAGIRASSEIGITLVESIGSINLLDIGPRFGIDHLFSIVHRIPVRIFGFDVNMPERIVRVSTAIFAGSDEEDIPPGLFGQMWLDFGVLGPVFWGILLGIQVSIVQFLYERVWRSRAAAGLCALLVFVVALPVNTGSYDFTFGVDMVTLACVLWLAVRSGLVLYRGTPDWVLRPPAREADRGD